MKLAHTHFTGEEDEAQRLSDCRRSQLEKDSSRGLPDRPGLALFCKLVFSTSGFPSAVFALKTGKDGQTRGRGGGQSSPAGPGPPGPAQLRPPCARRAPCFLFALMAGVSVTPTAGLVG